ncbi:MAG: dipicolinate synthase subunit DpsA [Lawsonibacter sp.]|jgi:dipicolinate synthase subunit A
MKHELNFWVVGGDLRQVYLANLFAEDGHTVHTYALNAEWLKSDHILQEESLQTISRADCVVLPLPVSSGSDLLNTPLFPSECSISSLLAQLSPSQFLCGGRVDAKTRSLADSYGLSLYDYFAREELAVANAVPTAEGAVQLAMEHLSITLHGARILVIGFGRVGRLTAQRMAALGAKVCVAARKYEQLAWAQAMGFGAHHLNQLTGWLCGYDLIVNTVPAPVLSRTELEDLKPDCLILDLASAPGGVDQSAAKELGLTSIWALSLPGKVAPATAGAAMKSTIYNMLREQGR